MFKAFGDRTLLKICFYALSFLFATNKVSLAQVTSDNTVGTQVNNNGNVAEITGGETRGGNLFHSFQDFSVPTNNEAFFNNSNDINNIFSRVTGGNVSNIDGLIRANGSASLFLINPAGIIFGNNASLNIGGSFYGSTAESILFENGEFSADLNNSVSLTVNAPIGLSFRDNPREIINRSFIQNSAEEFIGLEVAPGNNLALIGGDIKFEAGEATAKGGNIELGGLSASGTVGISEEGSLIFSQNVAKADISLSSAADVDVRGTGGGNITINARNLELISGELGISFLRAGITADSTSVEAQAGNITINATENVFLYDNSAISNQVVSEAIGSAGNINISTSNLTLTNGSQINISTFGRGEIGSINISANNSISLDGEDSNTFPSSIINQVYPGAMGNAEGINITTGSLSLTNGGQVDASTFGQGDAGSVEIAADTITIDGENSDGLFFSRIASQVFLEAVGNGGGIKIDTNSLSLTNGGQVNASTSGRGDAGSISIDARDTIDIDGGGLDVFRGVISQVFPDVVGNAGKITISTGSLSLANGGIISATTGGEGNAGSIEIVASDNITVDGENPSGLNSSVYSLVLPNAVGNAGEITIDTGSLSLTNGGAISTNTGGEGNAGSISITAGDAIAIDGESSDGLFSNVSSTIVLGAVGNASGITIDTGSLSLTNGGQVDATTFGRGDAGSIGITAQNTIDIDGEGSDGLNSGAFTSVGSSAVGNASGITIDTGSLSLTNGGQVDATTSSRGNAGSIKIAAEDIITIDGEGSDGFPSGITSIVNPEAVGNSGGIAIITDLLELTNAGRVAANAVGRANAGEINIRARNISLDGNNARIRASTRSGTGGIVNLDIADTITLNNNSFISAQAFEEADGGALTINTDFIVAFPNGNNDIIASADRGQGGNIDITAESLLGIQERSLSPFTNDINASSEFGLDGSIFIRSPDLNPIQGTSELPTRIVEAEATTAQICSSDRDIAAGSSLLVGGKGGIAPAPDLPLEANGIAIAEDPIASTPPQPVTSSSGQIQPARGIKVTETGEVILTAYRTQTSDRLPTTNNCGGA